MDSYLPFTNQASLARKDLLPMATFSPPFFRTTYIQAATPTLTMPTLEPTLHTVALPRLLILWSLPSLPRNRRRLELMLEVLGMTVWLWSPQRIPHTV